MMSREYKNKQRITCSVNEMKEGSRRCILTEQIACEK